MNQTADELARKHANFVAGNEFRLQDLKIDKQFSNAFLDSWNDYETLGIHAEFLDLRFDSELEHTLVVELSQEGVLCANYFIDYPDREDDLHLASFEYSLTDAEREIAWVLIEAYIVEKYGCSKKSLCKRWKRERKARQFLLKLKPKSKPIVLPF